MSFYNVLSSKTNRYIPYYITYEPIVLPKIVNKTIQQIKRDRDREKEIVIYDNDDLQTYTFNIKSSMTMSDDNIIRLRKQPRFIKY